MKALTKFRLLLSYPQPLNDLTHTDLFYQAILSFVLIKPILIVNSKDRHNILCRSVFDAPYQYGMIWNLEKGKTTARTCPLIMLRGMRPTSRVSRELPRLSPRSTYCPSGTSSM